jgi:hypothetical protein
MAVKLRPLSNLPLAAADPPRDRWRMLVIDCPHHGCQVLLPLRRISALHHTPTGIAFDVTCWCGTVVRVRAGRPAGPVATTAPDRGRERAPART